MRVVLIGAGISSSIISLLLRRQFGPEIKLVVLDKGRTIGNDTGSLSFIRALFLHQVVE